MSGEINKSRLESVLMLKKISYSDIDKAIGGDDGTFKFESLLKNNKVIPKNVERKLFDYLLTEKNIDIKAYVYGETDDINFDIKPIEETKRKRRVNTYGATTKDVTMSDEYIANHLNPSFVKDRYKELGFTVASLSLFINENYDKSFGEIMNPNRRRYLTKVEENNIGYLLETSYNTLVVGSKHHKANEEYKVPSYAKYYINPEIGLYMTPPVENEKIIKKLNISHKLYDSIMLKKFPIGKKFAEAFIKTYNNVFGTNYSFAYMVESYNGGDVYYDNPPKEEEPKKTNFDIDTNNLPAAWLGKEETGEVTEEVVMDEIKYSCKCGALTASKYAPGIKCSLCKTPLKKLGGYDIVVEKDTKSIVDKAKVKEEKNKAIEEEVAKALEETPIVEEPVVEEVSTPNVSLDIIKHHSHLNAALAAAEQMKESKEDREIRYRQMTADIPKEAESSLKERRTEELLRFEKFKANQKIANQVIKEEMTPQEIINYIDKHFNSLIINKMIDVLGSISKAKYNLEVADKFMDELNKMYDVSVEKKEV